MANELNRQFSEVQMTKKYMKKSSMSLAIKEMLIKITLRFFLRLANSVSDSVRLAVIKKTNNTDIGEDAGGRNHHTLLVGM
jgi:hypothetical protein